MDDLIITEGDRHLLLAGLFGLCVARFEDRALVDPVADLALTLGGDPRRDDLRRRPVPFRLAVLLGLRLFRYLPPGAEAKRLTEPTGGLSVFVEQVRIGPLRGLREPLGSLKIDHNIVVGSTVTHAFKAVTEQRETQPMTHDDVLKFATAEGFDLHERIADYTGQDAWGWHRGGDDRWPCFLDRRLATSWMRDRLRRSGVLT